MTSVLSPGARATLAAFARDRTLIALDFDGTLAPITAHPTAAAMRPSTSALLADLTGRYPVLVITGRAWHDVRRLVDDPRIEIIGNHGAEPSAGSAEVRRVIARTTRRLQSVLAPFAGAELENKTYSLSVHYRRASAPQDVIAAVVRVLQESVDVRLLPGKRVVNVVARRAPDKGAAVEHVRRRLGCRRVIFVGDDTTDESVFRTNSNRRLLGVRVGCAAETRAAYCLPRQHDIDDLLRALVRLRPDRSTERDTMTADSTEPSLGGTLEFMRLLWALDHALQKRSKWMATRHGVTGPQRLALRIIGRMPEVSAGRLAETLKVHPSTLTGVLQRLERRGLIVRRADRVDRRRVRLELTARGRAVTEVSGGSIEDAVAKVLRKTSPARLASTAALIRSLVLALEPTTR